MIDLLFKNAIILSDNQARPIFKSNSLGINQGKIAVLNRKTLPAKKIIDLKGKMVIPGLINCHTHAAMNAFRGLADDLPLKIWLEKHIWPTEKKLLSPAFVKKWTKQACAEMATGGTTCFSDMYFFEEWASKAARQFGLRMVAGEAILDLRPESLELTKNLLESRSEPLTTISIAPHSTYSVGEERLIQAKALADKYNVKLTIHAAETKNEQNDVSYLNKIGILDENTILIHAIWVNDREIDILAKKQVKIVHCPQSNMKLASGIAPIAKMLQAGITVGLGTDGAASNNSLDMFREMKAAALLAKVSALDPTVLTAKTVFEMATINAAKVLGLEQETGSLEFGKSADFAILDFKKPHLTPVYDYFSHLVYACEASDVVATYVAGKKIYQDDRSKFS